jgi:predicted regulator of Ras-like GTPase activity (Roadblock/LC7/MglB family)
LSNRFIFPLEYAVIMARASQMTEARKEPLTVDGSIDFQALASDGGLTQALESLASEIGGVRALVVGDRSGLPIVSTFRGSTSMTTTAMATLALSAATKVTSSLNLPDPDDILIEAGGWSVLVQLLGGGYTLTCVLPADENLGLVKLAMKSRGREIREILDELL